VAPALGVADGEGETVVRVAVSVRLEECRSDLVAEGVVDAVCDTDNDAEAEGDPVYDSVCSVLTEHEGVVVNDWEGPDTLRVREGDGVCDRDCVPVSLGLPVREHEGDSVAVAVALSVAKSERVLVAVAVHNRLAVGVAVPGDTVRTSVAVVVHVKVLLCVNVLVGRRVCDAVLDRDAVRVKVSLWVGRDSLAVLVPTLRLSVLYVLLCDVVPEWVEVEVSVADRDGERVVEKEPERLKVMVGSGVCVVVGDWV